MASGRVELDVENVTRVPVRRFAFFMKAIADNDLWDEVEFHLEDLGCTEVMVSSEPIAAIQELLAVRWPQASNSVHGRSGSLSVLVSVLVLVLVVLVVATGRTLLN